MNKNFIPVTILGMLMVAACGEEEAKKKDETATEMPHAAPVAEVMSPAPAAPEPSPAIAPEVPPTATTLPATPDTTGPSNVTPPAASDSTTSASPAAKESDAH